MKCLQAQLCEGTKMTATDNENINASPEIAPATNQPPVNTDVVFSDNYCPPAKPNQVDETDVKAKEDYDKKMKEYANKMLTCTNHLLREVRVEV